jgi:hypothetical protein
MTEKSESGDLDSPDSPPFSLKFDPEYGDWYSDQSDRIYLDEHPIFIYDKNRRKWVQLVDVDVGELCKYVNTISGWNGGLHFSVPSLASEKFHGELETNHECFGNDIRYDYANKRTQFLNSYANGSFVHSPSHPTGIGIRLVNASQIPSGGLTISSSVPVYIQGSFNTTNVQPKAAIHADSVTVLSNEWQDWASGLWNKSLLKPQPARNVVINAHIMTGTPHPEYMNHSLAGVTRNEVPDIGFLGAIRILEDWGTYRITLGGSLLIPVHSKVHWEPWVGLGSSYGKSLPPVNFSHNPSLGVSVGMPFYYRVGCGRTTRMVGNSVYDDVPQTTERLSGAGAADRDSILWSILR